MIKKTIIIIGSVLLITGMLFSGCHRYHHRGMSPEKMEWFQNRLAVKLDLDKEQKVKLSEITKKIRDRFPEMREKRKKVADVIRANFETENFDAKIIGSELDGIQKDYIDMKSVMVEALGDFHAILTPEQRKKFVDQIEKFQNRYNR